MRVQVARVLGLFSMIDCVVEGVVHLMDRSHQPVEPVALTVIAGPDALVLRLVGELDSCTAAAAEKAMREVTDRLPPPPRVVVDLTGISFLSAAGLRALHQMTDACAKRDVGTALVVEPDSIVNRVLRIMPFDDQLPSFAKLSDALLADD